MAKRNRVVKLDTKDLNKTFQKLISTSVDCQKSVVYHGSSVAVDAYKNAIKQIPIVEDSNGNAPFITNEMISRGILLNGITTQQQKDLLNGLGIAPMELKNTTVNTRIGFDGYGETYWARTANSKLPNTVLARAIVSGTYFRSKFAFDRIAMSYIDAHIQAGFMKGFKHYINTINVDLQVA